MKTIIAFALALTTVSAFAENYKVDTSATKIVYVGKKVTGEHTGNVSVKEGKLNVEGDLIKSGEVVVDMASLTSTDITDPEYNAKYLGHMKSADFFNVEKYPTSKLVIKNSKKTNKGLEVTGDLTLLGKTNPVTFVVADLKKSENGVTGSTNLTLNRTKWGLVYGSSSFIKNLGDKAIHDEFTLAINLAAKK